jgi:molecular chaperone GrpE
MVKKERTSQAEEQGPAEEIPVNEGAPLQGVEGDDTGNADEVGHLKQALEETRAELDRHREAMLRMQAEMDNQRKRLEREADKSRRFALERMMKDLLQVRDSLERGLEVDSESATVEGLREGKALTLKVLSKVMQDHGLEVIDPLGEPFNPDLHEAMTTAPSAEHEENTVVEVLQRGFKLHDRLVRPAMVVVSTKPSGQSQAR